MAYILDGVLILILVVTIALGYHRGFIRSIVQLVGLVAAIVVASSLSASLAPMIYVCQRTVATNHCGSGGEQRQCGHVRTTGRCA